MISIIIALVRFHIKEHVYALDLWMASTLVPPLHLGLSILSVSVRGTKWLRILLYPRHNNIMSACMNDWPVKFSTWSGARPTNVLGSSRWSSCVRTGSKKGSRRMRSIRSLGWPWPFTTTLDSKESWRIFSWAAWRLTPCLHRAIMLSRHKNGYPIMKEQKIVRQGPLSKFFAAKPEEVRTYFPWP